MHPCITARAGPLRAQAHSLRRALVVSASGARTHGACTRCLGGFEVCRGVATGWRGGLVRFRYQEEPAGNGDRHSKGIKECTQQRARAPSAGTFFSRTDCDTGCLTRTASIHGSPCGCTYKPRGKGRSRPWYPPRPCYVAASVLRSRVLSSTSGLGAGFSPE